MLVCTVVILLRFCCIQLHTGSSIIIIVTKAIGIPIIKSVIPCNLEITDLYSDISTT